MKTFISNSEISSGVGTSQEIWENIFSQKEWGKYPSENLIRFIARNFYNVKDRNAVKILELGLGTGANLWFCAREGFRVSGIEYTQSGIERFKKRMQSENLSGQIDTILQGDYYDKLDELKDESFDAVIDVQSLCCNDTQKTRAILQKAFKKLKSKGKFYSATMSVKSYGYEADKGNFQEITKGAYAGEGRLRFESKESLKALYEGLNLSISSLITNTVEQDGCIVDELYIIQGSKND